MISPVEQLFALIYDYVPDIAERREPHRAAHLGLLRSGYEAGGVRIAGATGDPVSGGLLVFTSQEAAEQFVADDPYQAAGLVTGYRIVPWAVAVP